MQAKGGTRMKKFIKTSLIMAGIFFLIGAIILIICSFLAGSRRHMLSDAVSNDLYCFFGKDRDQNFDYSYPIQSGQHTDDNAASASDITQLSIHSNYTNFKLIPSQDDAFHISCEGSGKYQYYTEDSVFYVNSFFNHRTVNTNLITLSVPDTVFSDVSIDFGAGAASLSSLQCDTLNINVGAGELTLDGIDCDYTTANVGAGAITIEDGHTQNADFEVGLGELTYKGYIDADLNAEVGMGSIMLQIKNTQEEHNYDLKCNMGNITIGSKTYNGIAVEKEIDNDADYNYTLQCDMGNISVFFEEPDNN